MVWFHFIVQTANGMCKWDKKSKIVFFGDRLVAFILLPYDVSFNRRSFFGYLLGFFSHILFFYNAAVALRSTNFYSAIAYFSFLFSFLFDFFVSCAVRVLWIKIIMYIVCDPNNVDVLNEYDDNIDGRQRQNTTQTATIDRTQYNPSEQKNITFSPLASNSLLLVRRVDVVSMFIICLFLYLTAAAAVVVVVFFSCIFDDILSCCQNDTYLYVKCWFIVSFHLYLASSNIWHFLFINV